MKSMTYGPGSGIRAIWAGILALWGPIYRAFRKNGTPGWGSTPLHISVHIGRPNFDR